MAKKGKKFKIDFGDTPKEIKKGGGKGAKVPEGDYLVKVVDCELKTAKDKKSKYFSWKFQIAKGKYKGKTVYGSTSLKPEALWSLRNLIHAATGKNVAGKVATFDPSALFGKLVGAAIEDNEYTRDGKTKVTSQVSTCFPKEEIEAPSEDDDEDEDEDEDEDDDDEDEEEDEEDDDEDDDLEDVEVEDI